MSLFTCMWALRWTCLVWQPEMSLSESCWALGGSQCVSPFYESPAPWQTSAYSLQNPPIDTHQNSNIKIPGHGRLVLERASYLKQQIHVAIFLLLPGNHQSMSQGAKRREMWWLQYWLSVGWGGDRSCFAHSRAVRCFWSLSGKAWHTIKEQSRSPSCTGLALMGALALQ